MLAYEKKYTISFTPCRSWFNKISLPTMTVWLRRYAYNLHGTYGSFGSVEAGRRKNWLKKLTSPTAISSVWKA